MNGNVKSLVRWDSTDPLAIASQIAERVRAGRAAGNEIQIAAVVVEIAPDGDINYGPCFSDMSVERLLWCSKQLELYALDEDFGGDADD